MKTDNYGQIILTENDLCDLYMRDPIRTIKGCFVDKQINLDSIFLSEENLPIIVEYVDTKLSLEEFDELNQSQWQMPQEYYEIDIAKWVLDQVARILHGTPILMQIASWENGHTEERFSTGTPTQSYWDWYTEMCKGGYDDGIAP